jgi:hypothetical protein
VGDGAYEAFIAGKSQMEAGGGFAPTFMPDFLFDFQRALVEWACRKGRAAIYADCGLGKGLPPTAPVLTPVGFRPIGELAVGDDVTGRDGKPHRVTGVFRRGVQPTYRVRFDDGTSVVCDRDHIWTVKSQNDHARGKPWRTISTGELLESRLRYGKDAHSRTWRIPLVSPVEFVATPLPIHPYVLGVLLGDGTMQGRPQWTKPDEFVAARVADLLPPGLAVRRHVSAGKSSPSWSITADGGRTNKPNQVTMALRSLGLWGTHAADKFVPHGYRIASAADRLALLQGLMDTDGYCGDPTPEFSSASRALADAVVFIVQSLGGIATLGYKAEPAYTYKGEHRIGQPSWRVPMSLPPGVFPFSLPRKAEKYRPTSRGLGRWIDSIEDVGAQETVCIKVDAADGLFVTEHFVVTHNTPMQLAWAENVVRHTAGRVLILTPLAVSAQTVAEGAKFGIEVNRSRDGELRPGINVTNYEMLSHFDPRAFAGVVLDEAGILKSYDGAYRTAITEAFAQTRFKLSATATPAPNDWVELGTQAEFLGVMTRVEMLATFFVHDGGSTQDWRLKGHAQEAFWRWVCSWAVMVRKPSDLGFDDAGYDLPPLNMHEHQVAADHAGARELGLMFHPEAVGLSEQRAARRDTLDARVAAVADLVNATPGQWLVWCELNAEGDALEAAIAGAVQVAGSDSNDDKEARLMGFIDGTHRVLVTKVRVAGFGLNLQNCNQMAFVGLSHSFEAMYQAVRRCWRFGQARPVDCHIFSSTREGRVVANVKRKEADAARMAEEMVKYMGDIQRENVGGTENRTDAYQGGDVATGQDWSCRLGDCVDVTRTLDSDSIDYTVFSPPFSSLYTYSASDRDMGNCASLDEFAAHFKFLVPELMRVTKPGRLLSFHCMNLPTSKVRDGVIGLNDFRGDLYAHLRYVRSARQGRTTLLKLLGKRRDCLIVVSLKDGCEIPKHLHSLFCLVSAVRCL